MSAKHTPGPWHVIQPSILSRVAVQRGNEGGFVIHGSHPSKELADANLIAAAPDLLAALKGYVDAVAFGGGTDKSSIIDAIRKADDIARSAIAKAEGSVS